MNPTEPASADLGPLSLSQFEKILSRQHAYLNALKEILDDLDRFGIQTLPLKGADLLLRSALVRGRRPMSDLDLLVKKSDLQNVVKVFEGKGFIRRGFGDRFCTQSFAQETLDFILAGRGPIFDLSWNLCDLGEREILRLWDRAVFTSTPIGDRRLLHPGDSLLYLVAYTVASRGAFWPTFVQDLQGLLKNEGNKIDWIPWALEVRGLGLQSVVFHGLTYARSRGLTGVPSEVFEILQPRAWNEKANAWFFSRMVLEKPRENPAYLLFFFGAAGWKGKLRLLQRAFFPSADFIELRCGKKTFLERRLVGLVRPFRILFRGIGVVTNELFRLFRD